MTLYQRTPVDHEHLEAVLQSMLGPHAAAACRSAQNANVNDLTRSEREAVGRAIAPRQQEFAAGREAARAAMCRLGKAAVPVPSNPDRSPQWPVGMVGSISHCQGTCVAVVALREHWSSVGLDVEIDRDMPSDLWTSICVPYELQLASELPEAERARWISRVFSAKEAYYKWIYPRIRIMLDFHEVAIDLKPTLDDTCFVARPLRQEAKIATPAGLEGKLAATQGMVITLMIH